MVFSFPFLFIVDTNVCCSVLPCVAVCCSVLLSNKFVVGYGSIVSYSSSISPSLFIVDIHVCCSVLQCVAVCCSVLQYVAVCCSVLHCVALCCTMLQCVLQSDKFVVSYGLDCALLPLCHDSLTFVS